MEKIIDGVKYVAVDADEDNTCAGCVADEDVAEGLCGSLAGYCHDAAVIWKRAEDVPTRETVGDSRPRTSHDIVNHPPHYTSHPSGIECIQITEHMGFNLGNAVKYIWRADLKNDAIEDLKKARWYIDRELKRRGIVPTDEEMKAEWTEEMKEQIARVFDIPAELLNSRESREETDK